MRTTNGNTRDPRVAVIGAGLSGLGFACKLRMAGIDSFDIYERAGGIGGTWHANTYPGLHCDVPSRYYQFRFAPNGRWSMLNSPGPEIRSYLERVAADFDLNSRLHLQTEVQEARWTGREWVLKTRAGLERSYDFVVTACGYLAQPRRPEIAGLSEFEGASFHSSEWDHTAALDGKRIAVIGTGSTGVQITKGLAGIASHYELYQRTPQWIMPMPNHRYGPIGRWLASRFPSSTLISYRAWQWALEATAGTAVIKPGWQRAWVGRLCRWHLQSKVRDPELRARFTPPDEPMCKRLIAGWGFYQLFERPDVALVDQPIDHICAEGIVTADGALHKQDVIVLATGFDAHAFMQPLELIGPAGLRLSEMWAGREPYGYRTVALPDFPNLFTLLGPHSPFGNDSQFKVAETQIDFVIRCIERWRRREFEAIAPTAEATERFLAELREAHPETVWVTGCSSFFLGSDGIPSVWSHAASAHARMLSELKSDEWVFDTTGRGFPTETRLDPHAPITADTGVTS